MVSRFTVLMLVVAEVTIHMCSGFIFGPPNPHKRLQRPKLPRKNKLEPLGQKIDVLLGGPPAILECLGKLKQSLDEDADVAEDIALNETIIRTAQKAVLVLTKFIKKDIQASLENQDEILNGQVSIKDTIRKSHEETRAQIESSTEQVLEDVDKVRKGQNIIVDHLDSSKASIQSDLGKVLVNQQTTHKRIDLIQETIDSNAKKNAQGQVQILGAALSTQKAIEDDVAELSKATTATQHSLVKNQASIENNFRNLFGKFGSLQQDVTKNQAAVQSEISDIKTGEGNTQTLVTNSQTSIQKEIQSVKKGQDLTQHLVKQCDSGTCDLSAVESVIDDIAQQVNRGAQLVQADIALIAAAQEKILKVLGLSEEAIVNEINKNHAETRKLLLFNTKALKNLKNHIHADFDSVADDLQLDNLKKEVALLEAFFDKILDIVKVLKNTPASHIINNS